MKKSVFLISAIFVASLFIISCGSTPDVSGVDNPIVKASNQQLAKYPLGGFAYKRSEMPAQAWQRWAKVAKPVVTGILDKIPSGYQLEVRGHADASGPEEPMGDKPGNLKISRDRAKTVYDALKDAGVPTNKMTYRGVGSSETDRRYGGTSAYQRRVTFVIVPK